MEGPCAQTYEKCRRVTDSSRAHGRGDSGNFCRQNLGCVHAEFRGGRRCHLSSSKHGFCKTESEQSWLPQSLGRWGVALEKTGRRNGGVKTLTCVKFACAKLQWIIRLVSNHDRLEYNYTSDEVHTGPWRVFSVWAPVLPWKSGVGASG